MLGLARPAALSVHLVHGGCPSKSWSGSGCAGTCGTPACARGNVLGHENTRSCSPRSSTCRAGDRHDTTIPSAEDSAHADVLSARGTKMKAVEKNKHRAREGERETEKMKTELKHDVKTARQFRCKRQRSSHKSAHTRARTFTASPHNFCPVVCRRDGRREVKTEVFIEGWWWCSGGSHRR